MVLLKIQNKKDFNRFENLLSQCAFILLNFLQVLSFISVPELILFPPEWLSLFDWLNVFALLDFTQLFDLSKEEGRILRIISTTVTPFIITGIINLLQKRSGEFWLLVFVILSFLVLAISIPFITSAASGRIFYTFLLGLSSLYIFYYLLRWLFSWIALRTRRRMGEDIDIIRKDQLNAESYVWLFTLVSVYSVIADSSLVFLVDALNGEGATLLSILGIIFPGMAALYILQYVFFAAKTAKSTSDPGFYSSFLVNLFNKNYWMFQVVILLEKTIHLVIRLYPDEFTSTLITLGFMFLVTISLIAFIKPFKRELKTRVGSSSKAMVSSLFPDQVDIIARLSNWLLLLCALLYELTGDNGFELMCVGISFVTGVGWIFVLINIGFFQGILYSYKNAQYKFRWSNVSEEDLVKKLSERSSFTQIRFTGQELEAMTSRQRTWILRYFEDFNDDVRSSILHAFAKNPDSYGENSFKLLSERKSLTATDCRYLGELLSNNTIITRVLLKCELESPEYIIEALVKTSQIEDFNGVLVQRLKNNNIIDLSEIVLNDDIANKAFDALIHANRNEKIRFIVNNSRQEMGNRVSEAFEKLLDKPNNLHNRSLIELDMEDCHLDDTGAGHLATALEAMCSLRSLNLNNNDIGDYGAQSLATGLKSAVVNLENISLVENKNISKIGISRIIEALQGKPYLSNLRIYYTPENIPDLQELIQHVENLKTLNDIPIMALKNDKNISISRKRNGYQDVARKRITDQDLDIVISLVNSNPIIESLNLEFNDIEDSGGVKLIKSIKPLKSLNLDANYLGPKTVVALVKQNFLGLKSLQIEDEVDCLARGLKENTSSTELNLSACRIDDGGARDLAGMLKVNRTLRRLFLAKNKITHFGAKLFADCLNANQGLKLLDLSENRLGNNGASILADSIRENSHIESLCLKSIEVENTGAHDLLEAFCENENLMEMDLSDNQGLHLIAEDLRRKFRAHLERSRIRTSLKFTKPSLNSRTRRRYFVVSIKN